MFEDLAIDDVHVAALRAAEQAASRAFVAQGEALLGLWDASPVDDQAGTRPHALAEAGIALGLHPLSLGSRLVVATGIRDQPVLRALLLDGRLTVPHALAAVDEVGVLCDEQLAARVLHAVLLVDGRLGWDGTPGELRTALQRALITLDPVGCAARREQDVADRTRVRLRPRPDGMADWVATGAADRLIAADRLLEVLSRPTGPDDHRAPGQRQLDALLGALVHRAGTAVAIELQLQIPVVTTAAELIRGADLPDPLVIQVDLTPELLHELTQTHHQPKAPTDQPDDPANPGDPAGPADPVDPVDPISQPPNRPGLQPAPMPKLDVESALAPAPESGSEFETPPEPEVKPDMDCGFETPPEPEMDAKAEPGPGLAARPQPDADADAESGGDDPVRYAAEQRHRPRSGVPELLGYGPIDPGLLLDLIRAPAGLPVGLTGLRIRRVCIDRTGQVVAVDATTSTLAELTRPSRPPNPTGQQPTPPPSSPARLLAQLLQHLPGPPPRTASYRPTADQTRVVRARDPVCCFPGCQRRARHTDLDHRNRWPHGPTSTANLHPLCRHHHRLKHDGWTCRRHPDGTTTWTSPLGQHTGSPPQPAP